MKNLIYIPLIASLIFSFRFPFFIIDGDLSFDDLNQTYATIFSFIAIYGCLVASCIYWWKNIWKKRK